MQTFYGAALSARDLAKIGLVLLGGGRYRDRTIVSAAWVKASTSPQMPSDEHGYLWWMRYRIPRATVTRGWLDALALEGFSAADKLAPLVGRKFHATQQLESLWLEAGALLDEEQRRALAQLAREGVKPSVEQPARFGFAADGWLGQQLIVYPSVGLVVVRQHEVPEGVIADDAYNQRVGYFSLGREIELALND